MDASYRLEAGSPAVGDYLRLRREAGLTESALDRNT